VFNIQYKGTDSTSTIDKNGFWDRYGCARTTEAVRGALFGPDRGRRSHYRRLSQTHVIAARRLYALQATIPNLTRSSLHRCLQLVFQSFPLQSREPKIHDNTNSHKQSN
jgi:hypothetical protein